ncbi:MAG TPA: helix-turn-helix transcriptional regulator [Planctomycetota bacterium]|nr:helix-turn-helix transcriptional regulator [Planctomycetota bacterium]HRR81340.1 helix-turn-helix transcriptional regulator [Planctomycetota bacterium]HRT95354.1 helix-turn-helix transcriptional regulator [Planctomycetota bacterium]
MSRFRLLRAVREQLGVSQSGLAELLGVSTRAVQSYEQGWRRVPVHVQKAAALLCYLQRRQTLGAPAPCWEVTACQPETRDACPVHQLGAGDLCWLLHGQRCPERKGGRWEKEVAVCETCPAMAGWLAGAQAAQA